MQYFFAILLTTSLTFLAQNNSYAAFEKIKCTTPICNSIQSGNIKQAEELIKKNPKLINSVEKFHSSLLHMAVKQSDVSMTKMLIRYKINTNKQDIGGASPLHIASRGNMVKIISTLLEYEHTDIDIQDNEGYTPLMRAVSTGRSEAVEELIKHNPSCEIRNKNGQNVKQITDIKLSQKTKISLKNYLTNCKE